MTDRFIVIEQWGYTINPQQTYAGGKSRPSYSVLDTCAAYREVATFYLHRSSPSAAKNEREAYALCRQLNRTEREHEAQFLDDHRTT